MQLQEELADRTSWSTQGRCPVEKAMKVVGSRGAMLTMREAFYGTRRFDDFMTRVGMSSATTASNLRALTEAGLLTRCSYQEDGARARKEYVLTEAGTDLMPVVLGLFAWGSQHVGELPPVELTHHECGAKVEVHVRCTAGHELSSDDIQMSRRASQSGADQ